MSNFVIVYTNQPNTLKYTNLAFFFEIVDLKTHSVPDIHHINVVKCNL